MIRLRHKLLIQGFRIFDQLLLISIFILSVSIINEKGQFDFVANAMSKNYHGYETITIACMLLGWFLIFTRIVHYDANRFTTLKSQSIEIVKAVSFTSILLLIAGTISHLQMVTPPVVTLFWIASIILLISSRIIVRHMLKFCRKHGKNTRHLLIIGQNEKSVEFAARIQAQPELGYVIEGYLTQVGEKGDEKLGTILGDINDLKSILERDLIDEVMFCLPLRANFSIAWEAISLCNDLGKVGRVMPESLDSRIFSRLQVENFNGVGIITFFRENLLVHLFFKRIIDVVGSLILLILLSPLLLLTALAIKLTSSGPVLFVQKRVGMNKRTFNLLKFRSMVLDAEDRRKDLTQLNEMDGPVFKIRNDPRVTKIGAGIRKLSIDELPQLINVLKGEMSLVGPRPPIPDEVDEYELMDRRRLSIRPGITCLWQVMGRNHLTFEEWMELDREYIDNWSTWLDIKILLMTIPVVLLGKGAS